MFLLQMDFFSHFRGAVKIKTEEEDMNKERIQNIKIEDYDYGLPKERIAQYPLAARDASKLLVEDGNIASHRFSDLPNLLPNDSFLVFNNTKVVRARLFFRKATGALIELFCLEPEQPTREIQEAFQQHSPVMWKCLVGNRKKWKPDQSLVLTFEGEDGQPISLEAKRVTDEGAYSHISFAWDSSEVDFGGLLSALGKIPLPPYMHRDSEEADQHRYQTVYAEHQGSVAAPTAGLHFTPAVFAALEKKGIPAHYLTLHVGAGTFKPVSTTHIGEHEMHHEQILVPKAFVAYLLANPKRRPIAVGTTSVRSMESLYWLGVKCRRGQQMHSLSQWEPYEMAAQGPLPSVQEALQAVWDYLEANGKQELRAETQLIIGPGYNYRIVQAMITNFHQPKSTLLLLIAAFLGDRWKEIYDYALAHDFRFLSYGDSCLFLQST